MSLAATVVATEQRNGNQTVFHGPPSPAIPCCTTLNATAVCLEPEPNPWKTKRGETRPFAIAQMGGPPGSAGQSMGSNDQNFTASAASEVMFAVRRPWLNFYLRESEARLFALRYCFSSNTASPTHRPSDKSCMLPGAPPAPFPKSKTPHIRDTCPVEGKIPAAQKARTSYVVSLNSLKTHPAGGREDICHC